MKEIAIVFGVFVLATSVLVPVAGSANYSPSNSAVEENLARNFVADGSPRPPLPPAVAFDGFPLPPFPSSA